MSRSLPILKKYVQTPFLHPSIQSIAARHQKYHQQKNAWTCLKKKTAIPSPFGSFPSFQVVRSPVCSKNPARLTLSTGPGWTIGTFEEPPWCAALSVTWTRLRKRKSTENSKPIPSMYGTFTYIWQISYGKCKGNYTIHGLFGEYTPKYLEKLLSFINKSFWRVWGMFQGNVGLVVDNFCPPRN